MLATNSDTAPPDWRPPQGLQSLAAVPVGGGRARAGLEGGPPPTGTHSGQAQSSNAGPAPPGPGQTALTLLRRQARGVPCS